MEEVAKFLFVGSAAVALFAFLTVSHWLSTRAAERRDRDRMALLRKVAEQPPETAALMRELLQEEDRRWQDRVRHKARQSRRDALEGGAVLVAVGVALSVFLYVVVSDEAVWTIGLTLVLVGLVTSAFAFFAPRDQAPADDEAVIEP